MTWLSAASRAEATSCMPAVEETLRLMPAPGSLEGSKELQGETKTGAIELTRNVAGIHPAGTSAVCVLVTSGELRVGLERVEVIEPTPEVALELQALEAQRSPKARLCGSLPYRAIHPGVYTATQACAWSSPQSGTSWPAGAKVIVNNSRTGVVFEYTRQDQPIARNYLVESATFPEMDGGGCSLQEGTKAPGILGLSLLVGLVGVRRRQF